MKRLSVALLCAAALCAQTARKPAAPKLTGFPFQDESLRYSIKWPSGLSLGDATFTARRVSETSWTLDLAIDAGVPGFNISDRYHSVTYNCFCSAELDRTVSHAGKKTAEKTTFDPQTHMAHRETVLPEGGKSDFSIPLCPRDALVYLYSARTELGQGRIAPGAQVYLGGTYSVTLRYTGEATVSVDEKPAVTDRVTISVRGPKADVSAEAYFARDAARTPLVVKLPLSMGTFSMELVR
jgi:Protein of unknown function (DUF3108)